MAAITVISYFLVEIPLEEYFDWVTVSFWIVIGLSFVFGAVFLLDLKRWWAGLVSGLANVALIILTLIDLLIYGKFPLLPGADITMISLISFISLGGIGIIAGKTVSDKKNGICIPFFEDCTKYNCDKIGNCRKV